jgi:hypothetical protein
MELVLDHRTQNLPKYMSTPTIQLHIIPVSLKIEHRQLLLTQHHLSLHVRQVVPLSNTYSPSMTTKGPNGMSRRTMLRAES